MTLSTAHAQFSDDFSDGDFTANPAWTGDATDFQINGSNQLQLNAPAVTDEAYLSTASGAINNATWECVVELDFNPSSSNLTQIYLVADQANLLGSLNGYFVRIGGTADEIRLYRQDGNSVTEIIDGLDDRVDTDPVTVRIRVTRDAVGNWELLADTSGGTNYVSEGTVLDDTHIQSNFFGVFCDYTSTRSDRFFFDDFVVTGTPFVDQVPPTVDPAVVVSDTEVDLIFSEPVDQTTAETAANYSADQGLGNPASAVRNGAQTNQVRLTFATAFQNGTTYALDLTGVEDLDGNAIVDTTVTFTYFLQVPADPGDILINEIFADPDPTAGLPEEEYVELYNNSNKLFDLAGWIHADASSDVTLPTFLLQPGAYVILCQEDDVALFQGFGSVLGLPSFPQLNNGGDNVSLRSPDSTLIDQVNYTDSWYRDGAKADGGFSLELINPTAPCGGAANWIASNATIGGTPGTQNSVFDTTPDTDAPGIASLTVVNVNQLELVFDETMDSLSLATAMLQISPALAVAAQTVEAPVFTTLTINLTDPLVQGTQYTLTVSGATDCSGNALPADAITFGLGESPAPGDLVLNELFPDPDQEITNLPDAEFVEVFNASDKIIDLAGVALWDASNGAELSDGQLFPGELLILCPSSAVFFYNVFGPAQGLSGFPSLNNTGDEMSLRLGDGTVIDQVNYTDSWYQDAQKENGGWTLERVNPFDACGLSGNWRASEDGQGGTPGTVNSIANPDSDPPGPVLTGASLLGPDSLGLFFDKRMDSLSLVGATVAFDPVRTITSRQTASPFDFLGVGVTPEFEPGILHQVVLMGITDCQSRPLEGDLSLNFLVPQAQDVVINEVLFNPRGSGTDFVELYNRSQAPINLLDWAFVWLDNNDSLRREPIVDTAYQLLPGEFALISEDGANVLQEYPNARQERFIETDLPSYSNDAGSVILHDNLGNEIDRFDYEEDFHFSLLREVDGVSLERLDYGRPTNDAGNWHSAAETEGFATPGFENSQFNTGSGGEEAVFLPQEVFSPDNDGFEDVLLINYQFDAPGFVANAVVYDAKGREVRQLYANELLAVNGTLSWDGTDNGGEKARIGVHVIFFEVFDLNGNVEQYKLPCVVATRF